MKRQLLFVLIITLYATYVSGYEEIVHRKITEKVISESNIEQSLFDHAGISLRNNFDNKSGALRVESGAETEDNDPRWLNHFYDPLTGLGLNTPVASFGVPSLEWGENSPNNSYNWPNTRHYYYLAMTNSNTMDREKALARVFRGLGQIIHLIQDKAVPAHVRNDAHAPSIEQRDLYEKYTRDAANNVGRLSPLNYAGYQAVDIATFNSMDAFWVNGGKGLAEFTNSNFLSRDTNIDDAKYPLPVPVGEWIARETVSDFGGYLVDVEVKYLQGYVTDNYRSGSSLPIQRLTAYSYFDYEMQKLNGQRVYSLNNFVHKEYADILLPRAVGYSAGLLDYFFRGNIEITLPQSAIYAFTGSRDAGFTRISLNAKNTTGDSEEMTDGSIELVVRYRTVQEDPFQPFDLQASKEYGYVVIPEANSRRSIPRSSAVELVFDRGAAPIIPVNAVDISLQIVYHGRLGNEDGAVAVGMKSISDPTPVELMNNMDKVCLNGAWYNAGSPEAIAQVDANHNGIPEWDIYPHNLRDAYVKISTVSNPIPAAASQYTYMVGNIGPGYISRAFMLAGRDGGLIHSHAITVEKTTTADTFTHASNIFDGSWSGQALTSQVEYSEDQGTCNSYGFAAPCAIRHAPPFYQFRGTYMWGATGAIFDNPEYPVGQKCQWEELQ